MISTHYASGHSTAVRWRMSPHKREKKALFFFVPKNRSIVKKLTINVSWVVNFYILGTKLVRFLY